MSRRKKADYLVGDISSDLYGSPMDGSIYGASLDDTFSSSMSQYMYTRDDDHGGYVFPSPEKQEVVEEDSPQHSYVTSPDGGGDELADMIGYELGREREGDKNRDEDARLADGITEVKNVVQEQFEDDVIASTLKDYDFNPSKALEVLLGKRSSNSSNVPNFLDQIRNNEQKGGEYVNNDIMNLESLVPGFLESREVKNDEDELGKPRTLKVSEESNPSQLGEAICHHQPKRHTREDIMETEENSHVTVKPFAFDTLSPDDYIRSRQKGVSKDGKHTVVRVGSLNPVPKTAKDLKQYEKRRLKIERRKRETVRERRKRKIHELQREIHKIKRLIEKHRIGQQKKLRTMNQEHQVYEKDVISADMHALGIDSDKEMEVDEPDSATDYDDLVFSRTCETKSSYEQQSEERMSHLNMVVVGHVDAGKSTLMGHLLLQTGAVPQRLVNRYQKESELVGKSSFYLAWVMDEEKEERDRGVTVDISVRDLRTTNHLVTILDAPGHRDFMANLVSGAAQGDVAILVIAAAPGEFESGFFKGGQTKEHVLLLRSMGVSNLIVAVNKLDMVSWSEARFRKIKELLGTFLKSTGFRMSNIQYVPVSGLEGINLTKTPSEDCALSAWYHGPTLLKEIDSFPRASRPSYGPLRLCVSDVYRSQRGGAVTVGGKVESGTCFVGQKVVVFPVREECVVKSISIGGKEVRTCVAGDNPGVGLSRVNLNAVTLSSIICNVENPCFVSTKFEARLLTFELEHPITRGLQVLLHMQQDEQPATISRILCTYGKDGSVEKDKPRCIGSSATASVLLRVLDRPLCIEKYSDLRALGRFALRLGNRTLGAGIVTDVL